MNDGTLKPVTRTLLLATLLTLGACTTQPHPAAPPPPHQNPQ